MPVKNKINQRILQLVTAGAISGLFLFLPSHAWPIVLTLGVAALFHISRHRDDLPGQEAAIRETFVGILGVISLVYAVNVFLESTAKTNGLSKQWLGYKFQRCIAEGTNFQKNGQYHKAKTAYQAALKIAEKLEDKNYTGLACYGLGTVDNDTEKYEEALNDLEKAIEYNPKLVDAYQEKSAVLRKMGRYTDSVFACQRTISLFPTYAKAHSTLGLAYEKLGDYENAIKEHLNAINLNPGRHFPRDRLYYCFYQVKNKDALAAYLDTLRGLDASLAEDIAKKLESGYVPEGDPWKDFEKGKRNLPPR